VDRKCTSVGLDVHARSVVACGLDGQTGEMFERRLTPDHVELGGWLRSLPGSVSVTYEAGPTGFGLARFLIGEGIESQVAAPSKPQRPGIGSRPTSVTLGIWPGWCTWVRSSRSRCRVWNRKPRGTWSGPAKMCVAI
jgi:hypothetical protein